VAAFKEAATSVISDCLDRLPGAQGIRPYHRGGAMAGTAVTVQTTPGDNKAIHEALEIVRPGDVLVVDGGGALDRALVGELLSAIAISRGVVGVVVDGAIRDAAIVAAGDFPVFARGVCMRGPMRAGPGMVNVPVVIGGMIVTPGDIVVGDADGVIAFEQALAPALLEAVTKLEAFEAGILASILAGTYRGAYAKAE
jgi:RraA family protein